MPKKDLNTTLSFTADFQQNTTETLKSGAEITILFDSNRLPFERSTNQKSKPEWSISAFYQFSPEGEVNELKLAPEKAKKGKDSTGDTLLKGVFTIPTDSSEVIIWFLNTGTSGQVYFDSNFGKNYHFPIVAEVTETIAPAKKARAKKA
ncbi:MAG: DUF6209 family protein [Acidobacteriota bacterium]